MIKKMSWYGEPYMIDRMPFNYQQDKYTLWLLFGFIPVWIRREANKNEM